MSESSDGKKCPETIVRVYEIADMCGNVTRASELIIIDDNMPPTVARVPDDLTDACTIPSPYEDYDEFWQAGGLVIDNCADFEMTWEGDVSSGDGCPRTIIRTYRFTDECGNYSDAIQKIIINDTIPPEFIKWPNDTVTECSPLTLMNSYSDFTALGGVVEDNCGVDTSTFRIYRQTATDEEVCPRTYTTTYIIEDYCGNIDTFIWVVTVNDTTPPVMNCPPDEYLSMADPAPLPFGSYSEFTAAGGTASDNCEIDEESFMWISTDSLVGTCSETYTYTYLIADLCGNTDTCTHRVFKGDILPPELICPPDIIVVCPEDVPVPFNTPDEFIAGGGKIVDNGKIDIASFTVNEEITGDGCPMEIIRTYQISDSCGYIVECTHTIYVNDTIPPQITCPADNDYECLNDESSPYSTIEEFITAGGTIDDNCAIDSSSFTVRETRNSTSTNIEITRWYSIRDLCDNIDSCLQVINLTDTIPPDVACMEIIVQLDETGTYVLVTAELHDSSYDECGIDTMYLERYILDCNDLGENLIKLYVVDVNGNIDSCTAVVTVLGNTPPVAVNDTVATLPGLPVDIDLPGNDYDTNGSIDRSTVIIITNPLYGNITVDPQTGIVTYTPYQEYSGIDNFSYTICDDGVPCGSMCDTAQVTINIGDYNNPPIARNDTFTVMCYPLTGNLMINDSDPDGHEIEMETIPVEYPANGTVLLSSDGAFHYMPDDGFIGLDSFVYRICDTGIPSLCDYAKVIITVLPDTDCDGVPDYDDVDTECSLLIPEGFSPNGDGVHDFFQGYCIDKYPDAIMRMIDRAGNNLFEKPHYGILFHWGSDQDAWWWGTSENRWIIGRGTLPAGNYLYILELGTGEVRTGTVMIAY